MGYCNNCNQEINSKFCPNCGKEAVELPKSTKSDNDALNNDSVGALSFARGNAGALVNELYALRAGLCRVSQENDKVKEAEESLEAQRIANGNVIDTAEFGYGQGNLNFFQTQRQYIIDRHTKPNKDILRKKNDLEKSLAFDKSESKKWLTKGFIVLPFFLLSIAMLVLAVFLPEYSDGLIMLGAISLLGTVLLGATFWSNFAKHHKSVKSYRIQIDELNKRIKSPKQLQAEINNDPTYIEYNTSYVELKKEYEKAKAFDYSPLENALSEQKNVCAEFYKEFYPAYLSHFERVLDPRDWCNLDLVIFILETGRADNLRDALIQVDGYRHTEAIAKAISSASVAICRTITNEADRLQRAIATHIDMINCNLGTLNSSTEGIIKVTELQNALVSKANASSERLANDLEDIRNYITI